MKTLLATLAAATAVAAVAAPAAAHPYGYSRWSDDVDHRQYSVERMIEAGVRAGTVTRREEARLRGELYDIARLEARYRYNGLSGWERADLDRRLDRLQVEIRMARTDSDWQYGYGYGRDHDRYDRYDRDGDYRDGDRDYRYDYRR